MPTESYDLIVVGDELPGLIAATLCARRGMRVLLAQIAPRPAGYTLGGIRLPSEPLVLAGLGGPAIRRVFDELHFQHLIKRKLRSSSPSFQLAAPDARIDIDSDDAVLGRELQRELGDDHPAPRQLERAASLSSRLERLFEAGPLLPPTGFWERRELGRLATDLTDVARSWDGAHGDALGAALAHLPAALTGGASPDALAPLAAARALDLLRQGAPRLAGDLEMLREILLDKFASHSGEVRTVEMTALMSAWGKVTGVTLGTGEELGAGHVIAALPVAELVPWGDGKMARRLSELAAQVDVAGYRYSLNLVIDAIGLPEGMGQTVLAIADPSAPIAGGNGFVLHAAPPDDHARIVVTAQAVCAPPLPGGSLEEALAALRARLVTNIELVMPFSAGHVHLAHSPNQAAPPIGAGADLGLVCPARPLWRPVDGGALGVAGLDYATGIKHLTLASSQVLPGLGIEGEFLAGWSAARIACDAAGKKRDFLRDELVSHGER